MREPERAGESKRDLVEQCLQCNSAVDVIHKHVDLIEDCEGHLYRGKEADSERGRQRQAVREAGRQKGRDRDRQRQEAQRGKREVTWVTEPSASSSASVVKDFSPPLSVFVLVTSRPAPQRLIILV